MILRGNHQLRLSGSKEKMMQNIVIGIEGLVGAGKTSICRELLKKIPNSVLLNAGDLYRAIVFVMMQNGSTIAKMKK